MIRKVDNTNEGQTNDSTHRIIADRSLKNNLPILPSDYPKTKRYIFFVKPEGYDNLIDVTLDFPNPSIDQERDLQSRQPFQSDFDREQRAFIKILPDLLKTLSGQYVAVLGGAVIDQDSDEIRLAERVESNHRSEFVLIRKVSQDQTDDYLESPEEELP